MKQFITFIHLISFYKVETTPNFLLQTLSPNTKVLDWVFSIDIKWLQVKKNSSRHYIFGKWRLVYYIKMSTSEIWNEVIEILIFSACLYFLFILWSFVLAFNSNRFKSTLETKSAILNVFKKITSFVYRPGVFRQITDFANIFKSFIGTNWIGLPFAFRQSGLLVSGHYLLHPSPPETYFCLSTCINLSSHTNILIAVGVHWIDVDCFGNRSLQSPYNKVQKSCRQENFTVKPKIHWPQYYRRRVTRNPRCDR